VASSSAANLQWRFEPRKDGYRAPNDMWANVGADLRYVVVLAPNGPLNFRLWLTRRRASAPNRRARSNPHFVARNLRMTVPPIRFVDTRIRFWHMDFRRK